jgi:hypothetical protein
MGKPSTKMIRCINSRIIVKGLLVFERYTERGRRAIFFARYEASQFGTPEITSAQLLLGILREDKTIAMQLGMGAAESIRKELEPTKGQPTATSVDLPVSIEAKRALAYAAEEAERLNHKHIHTPHLVLGLMRVEDSLPAKLLRKHGVVLEKFRGFAALAVAEETGVERAVVNFERRKTAPVAPRAESLEVTVDEMRRLVDDAALQLHGYPETFGDLRLANKLWTKKEAIGHLIDWAIVHEQWVTRALMESKLKARGYPDEAAVSVQNYADFPWLEAVDLWVSTNQLLIHVLTRVPEEKASVPCQIGMADPMPLWKLMEAYCEHCQELVGQIWREESDV